MSRYLSRELENHNEHRKLYFDFLKLCKKYNISLNISLQTYLEKYCVGNLYRFYCFYLNNLESFHFCKYLIDFCGKPIDVILKLFNDIGSDTYGIFRMRIPKIDINIKPIIDKILDIHLAFRLSYIFSKIDICIQSNTLKILYTGNPFRSIRKIIRGRIKNNKILDLDNKIIIQRLNNLKRYYDFKEYKDDEIKNYISTIYQNNKIIYDFITNHTAYDILELCKKKCEIELMIGIFYKDNKSISKNKILSYIMNNNPWLIIKLLQDEIDDFDRNQIKNLQINTKLSSRKIVIEI